MAHHRKSIIMNLSFVILNLIILICALVTFQGNVTALSVKRTIDTSSVNVTALTSKIPNQKGTLFGTDSAGNGIAIGNWLDYGSWLIGIIMAGQLYLVLWALVPIYYTLFAVTDPAELERRSMGRSDKNGTGVATGGWNFQRMVKMFSLAVETYQQLDMSEIDCQKKLICELQQGKDFAASTARTISNILLYFDFFKRIPHMEEYREAIKTGQRRISSRSSAELCAYENCAFSMIKFNEKYKNLLNNV